MIDAGAGAPGLKGARLTPREPSSPTGSSPRHAAAGTGAEQVDALIASKRFVGLLLLVAVVGVIVSLAAWGFLEAIHQIQQELYTHLPHAFGYQNGPPKWWPLPILAIGALIVALAITRLPGNGGHVPADGLAVGGPSQPEHPAGRHPRRAGDDRIGAGAGPRRSTHRSRRGTRRARDRA